MNLTLFFIICACFLGSIIYFTLSYYAIPTTADTKSIEGLKLIPENFSYPYYLDHTGIGFDIHNNQVYLIDGNITKTYNINNIREYSYSYGGETVFYGGKMLESVARNAREKKIAYDNSGLFIDVADINHPRWQIKFSDEKTLLKYYEILRQFCEVNLTAPNNK